MEWYFIGGFAIACAIIFIKWQIDYQKWKGPANQSGQKHNKETTATSATDVTSNTVGYNNAEGPDSATHNSITSATDGFDNQNDAGSSDINSSDNSGSETGGYDSGGYDSGGSYS